MPNAAAGISATTADDADGDRRFRAATPRRRSFGRKAAPPLADEAPVRSGMQITAQDVKEFLMAYCACFMAVMGLIA